MPGEKGPTQTMASWNLIEGSLGTPKGFRGAAVAAGIKKAAGALDLALVFSEAPRTAAAAVFTRNRAAAAPVVLSRQNLKKSRGRVRAIIANSGNANACTGRAGMRVAEETARATAKSLSVLPQQVLVASTGVIGVPVSLNSILKQLPGLQKNLSAENASAVAQAMMTTDSFPKSVVLETEIRGKRVCLAGVAKGAGMIHPHMATMLSFLTTDAGVEPRALQKMLSAAVDLSFNRISVDGDTSTNDTVAVLASGFSGVSVRPGTPAGLHFQAGLTELCQTLAKMIVKDGEGATKIAKIEVWGARSAAEADRVARAIATSPLVKTAIAGSDPNWGRILCAAGYSGAAIEPSKVDIRVNNVYLCRRGLDTGFNEDAARKELDRKEHTIRVDLHQGRARAWIWTCDFTHDYIRINASYRT
jgi:glutamate N-acetyltransferase/amino-acid N-acetyltransferase